MSTRIIPRLDIKGPNLVKGIHLEGLRVLGKPQDFAYKYYQDGADELIYIDLVASLYGRSNLVEIVSRTAGEIFIPLTVGGGVRTVEDMRGLLRAGADKVAVNTALFVNPELITEGARVFGSQCMVLYVEARKNNDGTWTCMHTNARESGGREVLEWVREMVDRGAGEILLTSVDNEGTGNGYDLDLVRMVSDEVSVPVIASGGVGNVEHMHSAVREIDSLALSASSIFHYHRLEQLSDRGIFSEEGNTSYIELSRSKTLAFLEGRISPMDVPTVKEELSSAKMECRDILNVPELAPVGGQPRVTVVDYGMGNLFSLIRSLRNLGAEVAVIDDPADLSWAGHVVLPGVGAFGDAMANLNRMDMTQPLREHTLAGRPLLGICLGMQLLLSRSLEFGEHQGLDIIPGTVEPLFDKAMVPQECKLPHIGWNGLLSPAPGAWDQSVLKDFPEGGTAYFVHSYAAKPERPQDVLSVTDYGGTSFCSTVRRGNVAGCQYHPELSGAAGQWILHAFLDQNL